MRSLTVDTMETSTIETASMDLTQVANVPKDIRPLPIFQALKKELPAIPKALETAVGNTQLGSTDLPFHTPMLSIKFD